MAGKKGFEEIAYRQGDPTAYELGRLTWNPLKHIDPFMTVLLPLMLWISSGGRFLFGGAKPIPLLIKQGGVYRTVDLRWNGGLRYPHLERAGKGPSSLDALLAPRK